VILAYHRVGRRGDDPLGLVVDAGHFRAHLQHLRERCYPLPLDELIARRGDLPPGAVALTFDDGYLDALTTAAPALDELELPATFFVTTSSLDTPAELWYDALERILLESIALPPRLELSLEGEGVAFSMASASDRRTAFLALNRRLSRLTAPGRDRALDALRAWAGQGAEAPRPSRRLLLGREIVELAGRGRHRIGAHSHDHLLLPAHPRSIQEEDVRASKAALEALLGAPVDFFAYPFGATSDETRAVVRAAGFSAALTVEPGSVDATSDPFRLPRHEIGDLSAADFAALIERLGR
jgi:peptidoglycan/xylan/chitin deacetylase (PgdA/CDA1 family)